MRRPATQAPLRLAIPALLAALAASPALAQATGKTLFVINNVGSPGSVSSFHVASNGALSLIGAFPIAGANPQYCALTPDGRNLLVANGTASTTTEEMFVLTVNADGTLTAATPPTLVGDSPLGMTMSTSGYALVPASGSGVMVSYDIVANAATQVGSAFSNDFPTKVAASPNSRFAIVAGSDSPEDVVSFTLSPTGALSRINALDVSGNSAFGAVYHPGNAWAYVTTGLLNQVQRYSVDPTTSAIAFVDQVSNGGNSAVEIAIHPLGTYLYVCNVVSDTLTTIALNPDGSMGAVLDSEPIGMDIRDVETDGKYVYVTDESSISSSPVGVIVFAINADGTLTQAHPAAVTGGTRPQIMALWRPPCGDVNYDFVVTFADLNLVLSQFGQNGWGLSGDVNRDGAVNFADLNLVLSNFGLPCD